MNHAIITFLDAVCEQVKCREVHDEIRLELSGHLEDLVEMHVQSGLSETDAVNRALADMGDPVLIGQQLHQTHRPRTEWGLIAAAVLLVLLGIWAMYAVDVSGSYLDGSNFLAKKLIWSAVGLALGCVFYFFDYRHLRRYSWLLYAATLVGALWLSLRASWMNQPPQGMGHTPMVFAVALAGLFTTWHWNRPWALIKAVVLFAAPVLIYLMYATLGAEGVQFIAIFGVLLLLSRPPRRQAAALAGLGLIAAGLGAWQIWVHPYLRIRLQAMIFPFLDPAGAGYQSVQSRLAVLQAGWWGQGATANNNLLPEVHNNSVFPYLVYSLGWLAGIAICLLIAFFLGRMLLASRRVSDLYGSYLIVAVATLFAFRFGWHVLMSIGVLPIVDVDLPFVSHGMQGALQLALVGLVLGVFRRKEMGRSPLQPE